MQRTARSNKELRVIKGALLGLTQAEIASDIGCHPSTVSRILDVPAVDKQIRNLQANAASNYETELRRLVALSLETLSSLIENPMVERAIKARVAVAVLNLAFKSEKGSQK